MSRDTSRDTQTATRLADVVNESGDGARDALVSALREIADMRRDAEAESARTGIPAATLMRDGRLNDAVKTLSEYAPELHEHDGALMQLEALVQRAYATRDALGGKYAGASTSGRPSGSVGQSTNSGYGYAFSRDADRDAAVGVKDAKTLRAFADTVAWLRAAITVRKDQVASAELAIGAVDAEKRVDKNVEKKLKQLLSQPNRLRMNPAEFWSQVVEDLLVLDRGCIEKVQDVSGRPLELYPLNGAGVQIYPQWDGTNDDAPRYLYVDPDVMSGTSKVPLRNDELVVMMMNSATYRYGLSPVAVLLDEIEADIAAVKAAKKAVSLRPPPHLINLPGYSDTALRALARDVEADYAGKKDLMFFGLDPDKHAEVFSLALDPKNSQFLELQVYLARKICAVMRISPQQVGITFDINKATGETQQDISEDTGLVPMLLWIEWYTNRELVADYAPRKDWRSDLDALNLRAYYPQISEAQRIMHAKEVVSIVSEALGGLPFYTLNMALAALGEEPVAGGDRFYVDSKNGPIPWLGYDADTGDYTPPTTTSPALGGQDAAGGPATSDSADDGPDEQSDAQDSAQSDASASSSSTQTPAASSSSSSSSDAAAASSSSSTSAPSSSSGKALMSRRSDARTPGVAWRPSLATRAANSADDDEHEPLNVTPRGRVTRAQARRHGARPYAQDRARTTLQAEVEAVFKNAARAGALRAGR